MKKHILRLLSVTLLITFSGCSADTQTVNDAKIQTTTVSHMNIETTIDIAGVFAPNSTENINTKMAGIVKEVNAELGQNINDGDTVIILDTKELETQLSQAKAAYNVVKDQSLIAKSNLDAAKSSVTTAKNSLNTTNATVSDQVTQAKVNLDAAQASVDSIIDQNNVQIQQAKSNVENAQRTFDREKQLFEAGIVPQTEFENSEKALDTAKDQLSLVETTSKSSLQAAQAKLDTSKIAYAQANGSGANSQITAAQSNVTGAESKVDTAQKQYAASNSSALEQAQASIDLIKTQLSNAVVMAHSNGVVLTQNIHVGELAQPGVTLVSIADVSKLKLGGTISQEVIPYIQVGQKVEVFADIYPDKPIIGSIKSIGPVSVATGSYFPIEIIIDNSDNGIMAGASGHATINISKSDSIVVPSSAIIENNGSAHLFVIENGIATKREVLIGLRGKDTIEILKGLDEGETIAITNTNTLFDNMPITALIQ